MKYYPTQVFLYETKTDKLLHVCCRPDALAPLCADLCLIGGRSAPKIHVASVEHRDHDIASFLLKVEVPRHLLTEVKDLLGSYRTKP